MDEEIAYQETLDYLYRFVDYSLQRNLRMSPEKFNLARVRRFLDLIDQPQEKYLSIHVAGTKGKGSVAAMCASALRAAGYRVGFYTSPHLQDYVERIQVDGVPILHNELTNLVETIKPQIESVSEISTFEITTGLAFLYFAIRKVDVAVIEVGLGGRLDATNVITPRVSVITSISYDHTYVLGSTLPEIAAEKAGIIKQGVPVVVAPQKEEVRQVVARVAAERSSPLIQVGRDYLFAPLAHSLNAQTLLIWSASEQKMINEYIESGGRVEWEPIRLSIPLLGYHQVENAATAFAALQVAREQGIQVSDQAIRRGFSEVYWPGRFEVLQRTPPVVIDSAHNRDSALKLRLALDDYFPGYPVILVFGASEDKDIEGMFAELMPRVQQVIATQAVHPRAADPNHLVEIAHRYGRPARVVSPVCKALEEAFLLAGKECVILAAGSLFVAAEVRTAWQNMALSRDAVKGSGDISHER